MNQIRTVTFAAGLALLPFGAAAEVPMPIPRPAVTAAAVPTPPPRKERGAIAPLGARATPMPAADPDATPCTDLLAANVAVLELGASVSGLSGDAICGDVAPARVTAIRLANGGRVELRPAALLRCGTALALAHWVREDLAPAVRHAGGEIERIEVAASYVCRPRNNLAGAFLSEHGRANAVDIRAVALRGMGRIAIGDADAPAILFTEMRRTACARFTTVLGPGADAAHVDHIHLDLARRRGGYRLCQWEMPDWPLP